MRGAVGVILGEKGNSLIEEDTPLNLEPPVR